jgi:putative spermidine/putrescine transport system permease protein
MLKKLHPYILILPFLLIMALVFVGGIAQAVVQSLGYMPAFGMYEITFSHYIQLFSNNRFLTALRYTFYIAFVSSALSVFLGVLVAFAVYRLRRGNKLSYSLYRIPIIIPHAVVVILIIHIFFQTGILSRLLFALGIISDAADFPLLIHDRRGVGIILTYLYKQVPFVTLTVFTVLNGLDGKYFQIAQNLGAGTFQTLRQVTLPMLAPAILSSFLITFAFGFGAFEVPFLLGSPARQTLPILAYFDHRSPVLGDRPAAMAMNVTISAISLSLICVYMFFAKTLTKRGLGKGLV